MIYAIEAEKVKAVKIGYCKDVTRLVWRYQAIDIHCPVEVRLAGVMLNGSRKYEKSLHKQWAELSLKGEWFRASKALRQFIDNKFEYFEISSQHKELAKMLRSSSYGDTKLLVDDQRFLSMDAPTDTQDESGDSLHWHEVLGKAPEQEAHLLSKELEQLARKYCGTGFEDIYPLRLKGFTFAEIASRLGKTEAAVTMAWRRGQKMLEKKIK